MNAYDEKYLDDAMKNLGEAFDYAVNACGKSADAFARLFITTGIADYFGKGNPKYVTGKSGTELAMDIFEKSGESLVFPASQIEYDCSAEYWAGWILAYYQWRTERSFREILSRITMADILKLYPALHEASEEKFVDTLNKKIANQHDITKLQAQRKIYGCSQRELSQKSGVNIRTLQQYEVGTKDISKASAGTVIALARTLGCSVEDLV